jgi:hypothetical protein
MTPWVHYIVSDTSMTSFGQLKQSSQPAQIDYSDLHSILSFFIGPPDGKKGGNDRLAQEIAEAGRKLHVSIITRVCQPG